jgi:hypothetical protein
MSFSKPRSRPLCPSVKSSSSSPSPSSSLDPSVALSLLPHVRAYARFLFDLQDVEWATSRPDILAILIEGLSAPPPPPWQLKIFRGSAIYYNPITRTSSDEHPLDAAVRSRCLSLVILPGDRASGATNTRRGIRSAAVVILFLLLAAAALVTHSFLHRAATAIDFECSWGMQLQQALALVGPCNSSIAVGSSYYSGGLNVISHSPTSINYTKAAHWFARALRRGCQHALRPYALSLYSSASNLPTSTSPLNQKLGTGGRVCDVMTECADAGHIDCIALLAGMLYNGSGGCPQDIAAGGQRAVAAGHGGSVDGACLLASMIADGRAFTRRAEQALKWAHVCNMNGGAESAIAAVQNLRQDVTPEEDDAARSFALQWRRMRPSDLAG